MKKSRPWRFLTIALCLAAVLGGAWICLLHAVLSARRDSESQLLGFRALLRNVIETV